MQNEDIESMTPTPVEESNMQKTHNPTPVDGEEIVSEMKTADEMQLTVSAEGYVNWLGGENREDYKYVCDVANGFAKVNLWHLQKAHTNQIATARREAVEQFLELAIAKRFKASGFIVVSEESLREIAREMMK